MMPDRWWRSWRSHSHETVVAVVVLFSDRRPTAVACRVVALPIMEVTSVCMQNQSKFPITSSFLPVFFQILFYGRKKQALVKT
jgi:hypothetical protein